MKTTTTIIIVLISLSVLTGQNVAINSSGASPNASAMLDVSSANSGMLIPRVALSATNNSAPVTSPATSLIVYNTASAGTGSTAVSPGYYFWGGSIWIRILDVNSNDDWHIDGNSGTSVGSNFIGTTDNNSFALRTNNTERIRVLNTGNVGIGTTAPAELLHLNGSIRGNQSGALRVSTGYGYVDLGPRNTSWSHFTTDRPRYWFSTGLTVESGNIGSYDENLSLQTSGTTRITAVNSNGYVGIGTTAPAANLEVDGGTNTNVYIEGDDGGASTLSLFGVSQGTGRLFVGQSLTYGGGIEYNGDNSPATTGAGADYITLWRRSAGTDYWTARNRYNSDNWEFKGDISIDEVPYNWPDAQGAANSFLTNDGSGNLSWDKMGWAKVTDIALNGVTSYTATGLDGNSDVAYKIVLMGNQVSTSSANCYVSINGDANTANYSYSIDGYWGYVGGYTWDYDAYNVGGILLWATFGGYSPNYVESETLLSSFTGNRRHGVTRYSLGMNSNDIIVNLSAGVWNNTTSNITSLVFTWGSAFTGRLIIYATH